MFPITMTETMSGPVPGSLQMSQREWNEIKRAAWLSTGVYWLEHFHAKHFTKAGAAEYKYSPRKGELGNTHPKGFWASYTGRKQKKFGHTLPLVYTGESRRVTRSAKITATASSTKSKCRVSMRAGNLGRNNPKSKVDMRDELTRVSPAEFRELMSHYESQIMAGLAGITGTTTRRVAA